MTAPAATTTPLRERIDAVLRREGLSVQPMTSLDLALMVALDPGLLCVIERTRFSLRITPENKALMVAALAAAPENNIAMRATARRIKKAKVGEDLTLRGNSGMHIVTALTGFCERRGVTDAEKQIAADIERTWLDHVEAEGVGVLRLGRLVDENDETIGASERRKRIEAEQKRRGGQLSNVWTGSDVQYVLYNNRNHAFRLIENAPLITYRISADVKDMLAAALDAWLADTAKPKIFPNHAKYGQQVRDALTLMQPDTFLCVDGPAAFALLESLAFFALQQDDPDAVIVLEDVIEEPFFEALEAASLGVE